ncbi:MAG: thiamine-binding protein [Saprospiraceae bacterium]|nr:thiamine-binding protein [Saprospiraceae bacterium]
MQITVEISFYPLDQAFGNQVLEFIADLKGDSSLQIRSNSMSTQISGDFDTVQSKVQSAVKAAFSKGIKAVVVMKMFNEGLELDWLDLTT